MIARVAGWNLHAALVFILCPEHFMHGFEPIGVLGMAAMRVTGILFTTFNGIGLVLLIAAFWIGKQKPTTF